MRKVKKHRLLSFVLVLMLLFGSTYMCYASEVEEYSSRPTKNLSHVDVYVSGNITVDTQLNGVSQGTKTGIITVSNLTATVTDEGITKSYDKFSMQSQAGTGEKEYHVQTYGFSSSAVITISGIMQCSELGINTQFSKEFSGDAIAAAIQECPMHIGCDFRITETDIVNTVTHDVIFKTEAGGKINAGTTDISYTNVIDGTGFPEIPQTEADEHYEFVGWYDEADNAVTTFPTTVDKDYTFIAKWKQISTDLTPIEPVAAAYFVRHYQEQLDGSYKEVEADAQQITANIGEEVEAMPKTYAGYTYNPTKSTATGVVIQPEEVEGNLNILTLKLYYDLNEAGYTVEYYLQNEPKGAEYTLDSSETKSGKLDASVTAEIKEYEGYEYNESKSNITGTVSEGLVLKIYYDKKENKPSDTPKSDIPKSDTPKSDTPKNNTPNNIPENNTPKSDTATAVKNEISSDSKVEQVTPETVEIEIPRTGENYNMGIFVFTAGMISMFGIFAILGGKKKSNK